MGNIFALAGRQYAAKVCAVAGVHADLLAFVDEGRNLDHEAGFRLGGLGNAGGSGRLKARLGLENSQFDRRGQLDAHCLTVVITHLDLQVRRKVLNRIAKRGALEHGLLVVHGIHEVVVVAIGVEKLH